MDYSYIAGFFDGEGNINKFKSKGRTYYQLRMYQSGDKGLKLLKEIKEFLGYGNLYVKKYKNPKWKDVWELTISNKSCVRDFKNKVGKYCKLKDIP